MPASIGVNLRVTGHCRQGGRKYMEDFFTVAYQQTEDEKDLEYAFFGIYDGHGGAEAAAFAKEHLMETIIKHKNFWSDNDDDVLRAIKDGYIATHYAMWREQEKWPKTTSGLPSTAGTTASVAFIRRGKIYVGHVGDSGIVLGYQEPGSTEWKAKPLTRDHKPENPEEIKRIESCGGKVVAKSGVPRVVWNRPKIGHQGPVRRSTPIDEIPFLAVARSLGDLWSYNSQLNQFVVSPDPDCSVIPIDTNVHRCLIFGTDGLFNMLSCAMAVHIVQQAERHNECAALSDSAFKTWLNPSKLLVEKALDLWHATKMRADNTSVVTLMLDPPGPPRAQVLKDRKKNLPESGLKIMTRYNGNSSQENSSNNCMKSVQTTEVPENTVLEEEEDAAPKPITEVPNPQANIDNEEPPKKEHLTDNASSVTSSEGSDILPLKEWNFTPKLRESTSFDPREPFRPSTENNKENSEEMEDNTIQINEISSSNIEETSEEESSEEKHKAVFKTTNTTTTTMMEVEDRRTTKRKLEGEELSHSIRKSLRITHIQKRTGLVEDMTDREVAPCTLAEEKLKRLAEEAEKAKRLAEQNNNHVVNLKADKPTKSKKKRFKKKRAMKKQLATKKIKTILEKVMLRSKKTEKGVEERKKVEKKPAKVTVASKISHFKRQSERNASKRQKIEEDSKKRNTGRKEKSPKKENESCRRPSAGMSLRSMKPSTKEVKKGGLKKSPASKAVKKQPARKSSLRQRIQDKTVSSIKRNLKRKTS